MNKLRINHLATADAEDLIATLWRALEERRIPSPELKVFLSREAVDLSLGFPSEQDANLMTRTVPRLSAASEQAI